MSTDRVDVGRGPAQYAGGTPNGSEPVERRERQPVAAAERRRSTASPVVLRRSEADGGQGTGPPCPAETMCERDMLASPAAVRDYLRIMLAQRDHEVFMVLFLDAQNRVIAPEEMFRGTLTQTSVYPREVVKRRCR